MKAPAQTHTDWPCLCVLQVIITTNNVLVMNPEDENVLPFITELKMKISQPSGLAGMLAASWATAHGDHPLTN